MLPEYCTVQSSCLSVASVLVLLRVAASNAGSKLWLVGLVLAVFGVAISSPCGAGLLKSTDLECAELLAELKHITQRRKRT